MDKGSSLSAVHFVCWPYKKDTVLPLGSRLATDRVQLPNPPLRAELAFVAMPHPNSPPFNVLSSTAHPAETHGDQLFSKFIRMKLTSCGLPNFVGRAVATPNVEWCVDESSILLPDMGISLHAFSDKSSQHLVGAWAFVGPLNEDLVLASYLSAVQRAGGIPASLVMDKGCHNGRMTQLQTFLR